MTFLNMESKDYSESQAQVLSLQCNKSHNTWTQPIHEVVTCKYIIAPLSIVKWWMDLSAKAKLNN